MKLYYDYLSNKQDWVEPGSLQRPTSRENNEDIGYFLSRGVKYQPPWYKQLTAYVGGFKKIEDAVKEYSWDFITQSNTFMTAKGCPAIQNYLRQNLIVRLPCDLIIQTDKDGKWSWKAASTDVKMSFHMDEQAPGLAKDYFMLKFNFNFIFTTNKKTQFQLINPTFYNPHEYNVSPGIADVEPNVASVLNVITFFPKITKRYFLKKDTVLCTMQFNDRIEEIEKKNLKLVKNNLQSKTFANIKANYR